MNYFQSFAISSAGMTAERTRVEIAAVNLANANAAYSLQTQGYQAMRAVVRGVPFQLSGGAEGFARLMDSGFGSQVTAPEVSVRPAGGGPRVVYDPSHPLANDKGMIAFPNVDTATEMISMMSALRAYESNVVALNTARTLSLKALEIGGGS